MTMVCMLSLTGFWAHLDEAPPMVLGSPGLKSEDVIAHFDATPPLV